MQIATSQGTKEFQKHCRYGHDFKRYRQRTPGGQTYCALCKAVSKERQKITKGAMVSPEAVEMRGLLRQGLTLDASSPEMQAWQRRVFEFFGMVAQGRIA